jgi:hypothetical protein
MRFLGLGLGDRVPDAKTVWLYRDALAQAGKVEELFDGHLARQGYIAYSGTSGHPFRSHPATCSDAFGHL